ncbi:hypothetical protein CRM22_011411 [Opisthorchis felineus]|uniref:VWFC domain-containing protein n=1 Tax=Opisthorchis felineus TaxID=147828 RepID=A0A4S2JEQ3_OPIFE|nr:hypothetical protein CRM22_011411 [Opisthorchis felineus]
MLMLCVSGIYMYLLGHQYITSRKRNPYYSGYRSHPFAVLVMDSRCLKCTWLQLTYFLRILLILSCSVHSVSSRANSLKHTFPLQTHLESTFIYNKSQRSITRSNQLHFLHIKNCSNLALFFTGPKYHEFISSLHLYHWFIISPFVRTTRCVYPRVQMLGILILIYFSFPLSCMVEALTSQDQSTSGPSSSMDLLTKEHLKSYCIDSNGTHRGLFSSWIENSTCRCICSPIARMAVSVCEGCSVRRDQSSARSHQPMARSNDHVTNLGDQDSSEDRTGKSKRKGCLYPLTGVHYRHAEIWMSAKTPCGKCRCEDGTIKCTGEPHHCPMLCLPGQKSSPPGPCCETTCRGKAVANLSLNFANCFQPKTGVMHAHGDHIWLPGSCVDQQCHCVNGRWDCLDYCVPLPELPCQRESVIVWDPFCCPRCAGTADCTVSMYADVDNTTSPGGLMTLSTGAVTTFKPETPSHMRETRLQRLSHGGWDSPLEDRSRTLKEVTIPPGSEVALLEGYCFCLNSTIFCSRQGRNIWHDEDCYFSDGTEETYYPPEAQWIPHGDPCTECRCLHNRTYTCAPKKCTNLFLCPSGQKPIAEAGECCPSTCGFRTKSGDAETALTQPPIQRKDHLNTKPTSIGQPPPESVLQTKASPVDKLRRITEGAEINAPHAASTGGCPALDGADTRQMAPFPPGSRLMLTRPCRSLLCVCAHDHRWLCTDHCQPCIRTFDSIEKMDQMPQPPPGRCCPPCNPVGSGSLTGWSHNTQINLDTTSAAAAKIKENYENSPYNSFLAPSISVPGMDTSFFIGRTAGRQQSVTNEQIKRTLKIYVLVASSIMLCILGFPMVLFITWFVISRRRRQRRRLRQYQARLKRRKQLHSGLNPAIIPQLKSTLHRTKTKSKYVFPDSSASPQTSSSHSMSPLHPQASRILSYSCKSTLQDTENSMQTSEEESGANKAGDDKKCVVTESTKREDFDIPPSGTASMGTKSVPSSPILFTGKPRRVKSALKSTKTFADTCSGESKRAVVPIKSTYYQTIDCGLFAPHLAVNNAKIADSDNKSSVRRTASNILTRVPVATNRQVKLTRASTWLTGARTTSPQLNCLPLLPSKLRDTQQFSGHSLGTDVSLDRRRESSSPDESDPANGNSTAHRRIPRAPTGTRTEPIKTELQTDIQPNIVRIFANCSKNMSEDQQPDQRLVKHHFAHAHRPTSIATRPSVRTSGFERAPPQIQQEEPVSPETDNTSITDSQTPVMEKPLISETSPVQCMSPATETVYRMPSPMDFQQFASSEELIDMDVISSKPKQLMESSSTWPRSRYSETEETFKTIKSTMPSTSTFTTDCISLHPVP